MKTTIQVVDTCQTFSAVADSIVKIQKIGGLTHIIFAETRASAFADEHLERFVTARLVIPTELVSVIGKALIAGENTIDTTFPHDGQWFDGQEKTH